MSSEQAGAENESTGLEPWLPSNLLSVVPNSLAQWSRGFLRCRPEKWFPGLSTDWLPLAHALGFELRVTRVTPMLAGSPASLTFFRGYLDDEPIAVAVGQDSEEVLGEALLPGLGGKGWPYLLDYLARRLLTGLASTWSGPERATLQYDSQGGDYFGALSHEGAAKVEMLINGRHVELWVLIGGKLIALLDGLWRRQLRSTSSVPKGLYEVRCELAQIAVQPSMLVDYMRLGTAIDLEVPVSDIATLRIGAKPWLTIRLCRVDHKIAFETLPAPVAVRELPTGTTRVTIEFPQLSLDEGGVIEIAQPGALLVTEYPLTNRVDMIINGEKVAEATLQMYEGRFAITVL